MKLSKLNQQGVAHLAVFAVLGLAVVGGVGYKVYASQQDIASTGVAAARAGAFKPTPSCAKKALRVAGFQNDMALFASYYYVPPSNEDLQANYTQKQWKQLDGSRKATYTGEHKVTVYKNGQPTQAKRINYAQILTRHQGALSVAKAKIGDNTEAYSDAIDKLDMSIHLAMNEINDRMREWHPDAADCSTREGANVVKLYDKQRTIDLKAFNKTLKGVKQNSKKASREYTKVAKDYAKVLKAEKRKARH